MQTDADVGNDSRLHTFLLWRQELFVKIATRDDETNLPMIEAAADMLPTNSNRISHVSSYRCEQTYPGLKMASMSSAGHVLEIKYKMHVRRGQHQQRQQISLGVLGLRTITCTDELPCSNALHTGGVNENVT